MEELFFPFAQRTGFRFHELGSRVRRATMPSGFLRSNEAAEPKRQEEDATLYSAMRICFSQPEQKVQYLGKAPGQ